MYDVQIGSLLDVLALITESLYDSFQTVEITIKLYRPFVF